MDIKPLHSPVTGHVVLTDDLLTFNSTEVKWKVKTAAFC